MPTIAPYANHCTMCQPLHHVPTITPCANHCTMCQPFHHVPIITNYYTMCQPLQSYFEELFCHLQWWSRMSCHSEYAVVLWPRKPWHILVQLWYPRSKIHRHLFWFKRTSVEKKFRAVITWLTSSENKLLATIPNL